MLTTTDCMFKDQSISHPFLCFLFDIITVIILLAQFAKALIGQFHIQ